MEKSKIREMFNLEDYDKNDLSVSYLMYHEHLPKHNEDINRVALMCLAHIPDKWALDALKEYVKANPNDVFGELALDECIMWNKEDENEQTI